MIAGVVCLIAVVVVNVDAYQDEPLLYETFPDGFAWALATASYQIEGAWNEDGKSESIWDTFTHAGGHIDDESTGDVACDSYHKWEDDIALLVDLGVTHYRFSIAWTRILPEGTGAVNQLGVDYYNKLIDGLLAAGIEPMVTLYHWDLPQILEDQGGWLSPSSADWFEEYAAASFAAFGDRVKLWLTFNEPWVVCVQGYGTGEHAPGYLELGTYPYECAHNIIRSHGRAYRRYKEEFAAEQGGEVGITLNINAALPATEDPENVEAADRELQFNIGWFAHPILKDGNYPQVMIDRIGEKSEAQGFPESRLPTFTQEEMDMIVGSADFLGINHYTAALVEDTVSDINDVGYFADHDTRTYFDPTWYPSGSFWLKPAPYAFRILLNWLKNEYNNMPTYITENGFSDRAGNLDDLGRIYYYKHYINNLLKAVTLDGCNVKGYTAWSLMDNFEWARGYTEKFGVHAVDFNDPGRPRTIKASGKFLKDIIANNGFVENPTCPYYDVFSTFSGASSNRMS